MFFIIFILLCKITLSRIYENCDDFLISFSSSYDNSKISLALNQPCLFNKSIEISQNLTIESYSESIFLLSDNFSFIIHNQSSFSLKNTIIKNNNNQSLITKYIFFLSDYSALFLQNVTFKNFEGDFYEFSLLYGENSNVFIESCFFSKLKNMRKVFLEMKNRSNLIIFQTKIQNCDFLSGQLISLNYFSSLNVSDFIMIDNRFCRDNNCDYSGVIENDYFSYFSIIFLENNIFFKTFIKIFDNSLNFAKNVTIEIYNSNFISVFNNNDKFSALFLEIKDSKDSTLIIKNSTFYNNEAKFSFFSLLSIKNIYFTDIYFLRNNVNFAILYGTNGYSLIMSNITFENNNYNNFNSSQNLWSGSCIILENFLIREFNNLTIKNSSTYDSTVGIQFHDISSKLKSIYEKYGDKVGEENGVIVVNCSSFTKNYVFYKKNFNISGIFYVDSDSKIYILNSYLSFNQVDSIDLPEKNIGGPCLNSFSIQNHLIINNSIFKNNSAKFISNCMFFMGAELVINNTMFDSNAPLFGEKVLAQYLYLKKTYARVLEALPYGFGGALRFQGEVLNINRCHFSRNQGYSGGGLLIAGSNFQRFLNLKIESTTFEGNSVGTMGGGIYFTNNINNFNGVIQNSMILLNDARYGGGISTEYAYDHNYLALHNMLFYANQAQYAGGLLIHQIKGLVNLTNSKFIKNRGFIPTGMTLPILGGAVGIWGSAHTLGISKNNYFLYNSADIDGGAFGMLGSNLTSENDTFEKNVALYKGSLFSVSAAIVKIINATIFDNFAYGAATALAYENSFIIFVNVVFRNNTASKKSGLIELYLDSSLIAYDLIINGSSAPLGGIMNFYENYDAKIEIFNSTFLFNSAMNFLIDLSYSNIVFNDCRFYNNTSSLFGIINVELNITNSEFLDHSCLNNNFIEGCLLTSNRESKFHIFESKFTNIISLFHSSIAFASDSKIIFSQCLMYNIHSIESKESIYVENSELKLESNFFYNSFHSTIYNVNSSFSFMNSLIENTIDDFISNSVIKIENSKNIHIFNSKFVGNIAKSNGSSLHIINTPAFLASRFKEISLIIIENSLMINCRSNLNGGAIYIYDVNVVITNCSLINNSALNGGAIFFETSIENSTYKLIIKKKNEIKNNQALKGGGGIMWIKTLPILSLDNLILLNNEANYGNNLASQAIRIFVTIYSSINESIYIEEFNSKSNFDEFIIQNQIPGQFLTKDIIFSYIDYYNQTIKILDNILDNIDILDQSDYDSFLKGLSKKSTNTFLYGQSFLIKQGEMNVSNIKIYTAPAPGLVYLILKTAHIPYFSTYISERKHSFEKNLDQSYFLVLPISISPCRIGEISLSNNCHLCQNNKFSLNSSETSCRTCPNHAICPLGSILDIESGYWRSPNSSKIFDCEMSSKNCNGGINSDCLNNFIGPFCRSCPAGFYELKNTACLGCDSIVWNIFRGIGVILALVVLLFLLVKSALENTMLYNNLLVVYKLQSIDENILKKSLDFQSIYIKIFVNYLQIYTFLRLMPFSWAPFFKDYIDIFNSFASISTKFIAFECIFKESYLSEIRLFKFLCMNLLPFVLVLLSAIGFILFYKLRRKKVELKSKIYSTCFGVYYMILPSILQESLRSLSCIKINDGEYLKYNPIYLCDADYKQLTYFVVWPLFFCWSIVFPGATFIFLAIKRKSLYQREIFQNFNFIYIGYKTKYFYWDMIIFIKKFLTSLLTIFSTNSNFTILILGTIIGIYSILFIKFKPFLNPLLNTLEYMSCIFLFLGIFINSLINQTNIDSIKLMLFLNVVLFLLNLCFFLYWAWQFLGYSALKYKKLLQKKFPLIYSFLSKIYHLFDTKVLRPIKVSVTTKRRNIALYLGSPKQRKSIMNLSSKIKSPSLKHNNFMKECRR